MLVCGHSTTDAFEGTVRGGITRLNADGSRDASFDPGAGVGDGTVSLITLQPDGRILIGGSFTAVDGVSRPGFARLNVDGSLDTGFGPDRGGILSSLLCIVLQQDGKVLCVGSYTLGFDPEGYPISMPSPFRLHADGSLEGSFRARLSGPHMEFQGDGRLLIGGGDLPGSNIGRLHGDHTTVPL